MWKEEGTWTWSSYSELFITAYTDQLKSLSCPDCLILCKKEMVNRWARKCFSAALTFPYSEMHLRSFIAFPDEVIFNSVLHTKGI